MSQLKFVTMDDVLHDINKRYISLSKLDEIKNNAILLAVLYNIIDEMKSVDPLFKEIYKDTFFGGSYYDDLRITRPNEFDLDLLFKINKFAQTQLVPCDIPGFMLLKVTETNFMNSLMYPEAFRQFERLLDANKCVRTDKTVRWMYSVMQQVMNRLPYIDRKYVMELPLLGKYKVNFKNSGPAITLNVFWNTAYYERDDDDDDDRNKIMSIDFVPCFRFTKEKWPPGFIENPVPSVPKFFLVPKQPKVDKDVVIDYEIELYWRLSFQAQEQVLISGKQNLKPTIKLLKKMRNKYKDSKIASYFIKTVALHVMDQNEEAFWSKPLSYVFMEVLKAYRTFILNRNIPYYWNERYNLIENVRRETLDNIGFRLDYMIKDIERNADKPETVAKYLLSAETYDAFIKANTIGGEGESSGCILQ